MSCRKINQKELEIYLQASLLTMTEALEMFCGDERRETILNMEKRGLVVIVQKDPLQLWFGFYFTEKGIREAQFWKNYYEL